MSLFQLVMTRETAWSTMNLLGELGEVHIVGPGQPVLVQGPFAAMVKRIQITLDHLETLRASACRFGKAIFPLEGPGAAGKVAYLLREWAGEDRISKQSGLVKLEAMERHIEDRFRTFSELESKKNDLKTRLSESNARRLTYRGAQKALGDSFFTRQETRRVDFSMLGQNRNVPLFNMGYFALVTKKAEAARLEKLIFRVSRGNTLVQMVDCEELG